MLFSVLSQYFLRHSTLFGLSMLTCPTSFSTTQALARLLTPSHSPKSLPRAALWLARFQNRNSSRMLVRWSASLSPPSSDLKKNVCMYPCLHDCGSPSLFDLRVVPRPISTTISQSSLTSYEFLAAKLRDLPPLSTSSVLSIPRLRFLLLNGTLNR